MISWCSERRCSLLFSRLCMHVKMGYQRDSGRRCSPKDYLRKVTFTAFFSQDGEDGEKYLLVRGWNEFECLYVTTSITAGQQQGGGRYPSVCWSRCLLVSRFPPTGSPGQCFSEGLDEGNDRVLLLWQGSCRHSAQRNLALAELGRRPTRDRLLKSSLGCLAAASLPARLATFT